VEELQVINRFEGLRRILLGEQFRDHIDKPLAYWALPTDRRLPLAFLGRTLRDLLNSPFAELTATQGIGQKKITSFVALLARVANTNPAELPVDLAALPAPNPLVSANGDGSACAFDPGSVSEVVWTQWRASVIKHGLGDELLGRFAPSLKNMTRVIWSTPLEAYTHYTLAEIRAMKTHGEKRVRAILEVFHSLHALIATMGAQEHLVVRICPRRIDGVERWIEHLLQTPGMPGETEILQQFVGPLLEQIRTDASQQITNLAENRLGTHGPIASVRQAARIMGLTRARVYQLLNEINDIMSVRWPNGRHQAYELSDKLHHEASLLDSPPNLDQFHAAVELFYPGARRGASGPLDQVLSPIDADLEPYRTNLAADSPRLAGGLTSADEFAADSPSYADDISDESLSTGGREEVAAEVEHLVGANGNGAAAAIAGKLAQERS
jgi:hypothetical protein